MDFTLSESQREIWRWANAFADREIAPRVAQNDRLERFDRELLGLIAEQGFFGAILPEEYGGQGVDHIAYALMTEAIARVCSSTRTLFSVQISLVEKPLLAFGTAEQKARYLPALASGECIGCFGLTEPNAGSDAANQQTTATRDGDHWTLNGQKTWISNGSIAHLAIIIAQTDPALGTRGMAAFLVDTDSPGFSARAIHPKLGLKALIRRNCFWKTSASPTLNAWETSGKGLRLLCTAWIRGGSVSRQAAWA